MTSGEGPDISMKVQLKTGFHFRSSRNSAQNIQKVQKKKPKCTVVLLLDVAPFFSNPFLVL